MAKVWIVILAAGQSKRFKDVGYTTPKPCLMIRSPRNTRSMLAHVIDSLPMKYWLNSADSIVVGLPVGVDPPHDLATDNIVRIKKTKGQADTLLQIVKTLPETDSVLVMDCDTILNEDDVSTVINLLNVFDVVTAVIDTFDPNMSRVDSVPFPTYFAEKEPISVHGIVGIRGFKSIGALKIALYATLDICRVNEKEPYATTAMNLYKGKKFAHTIHKFVDLGTPERVRNAGWEIL